MADREKLLGSAGASASSTAAAASDTAKGEKKRSPHAWQNHVTPLALYVAVCVADLVTVVILYEAIHNWDGDWSACFSFRGFSSFSDDTVDAFWTALARVVIITLLGHSAVTAGTPDFENPPPSLIRQLSLGKAKAKEEQRKAIAEAEAQAATKSLNANGVSGGTVVTLPDHQRALLASTDSKQQPLLPAANGTSDAKDDHHHGHSHAHGNGHAHGMKSIVADEPTRPSSASTVSAASTTTSTTTGGKKELTEADRYVITQAALSQARIRIVVLFLVTTCCQVFTGLKMVSYSFGSFDSHTVRAQAVLMGLSVIWINLEWMYIREIIEKMTREMGYLFATLHPHYLYYQNSSAGHWCDLCRSRLLHGESYRCTICDFDLCVQCFKKKNKSRGEGLLRGDKGVKDEKEVNSTDYLLRALALARPYKAMIGIACVCLLATSASALLLPNYQGQILDDVISADRSKFAFDVKLFIAMSVATGFFGSIRSLCFSVVGAKMANDVRVKLFQAVIIQDIAFFDGISTGELTSRLSQDANAMVQPCQTVLNTFLSNFLLFVGGLVMCFVTSWRLSVLAITSIGPIIQITQAYAKWSRQINKEIWAALGDASSIATQAISNIRTVRAFGCEENETKNYLEAAANALNKGVKDAVASAGTYALTNYFDLGCTVLLLWYGGRLAMDDEGLTVGKLITFQLYWGMINSAYQQLMNILTQFTRAAGAATRVLSLMDSLPDIDPHAGAKVDKVEGAIHIDNIDYTYQMRPDNKVLDGMSLDIKAGSVVALVGKSGGGKSTLVHLMMRFYDPSKGKITLDGVDLTTLNLASVHKHMGLVAQDTQLFSGTIEENIAYGMDEYTQTDLINAAKKANAHDFIMQFEEDYKTRVGERGVRLSGGQKQRIAIARAMLRSPSVLFLDEATSSLDTESEALVQTAIDNLMAQKKCTVVLVAHRLSTVINADKIAVIDKGRIIESGNHNELLAKNGVYARLVARQIARKNNTLEQDGEQPNAKKLAQIDTIDNLLAT